VDINLFTDTVKPLFFEGLQAVPEKELQVAGFTNFLDSTARIENYDWLTPPPGIALYQGYRRYASLSSIPYKIENQEFDAALQIKLRDIEDDKIGGWPMRFNQLGGIAARFPERWIYQTLANGDSNVGFDNTNYFNTTHNQGGGGLTTLPSGFTGGLNKLTFTSTNSSDGATGKAIFIIDNQMSGPVKPIIYQKRKPPKLKTDSGTPGSEIDKLVRYVIDLEAAALYGYWWDAILVNFVNTPSVTDIQTVLDVVVNQFQSLTMPRSLPSDPNLYFHQGIDLTKTIGTCVSGLLTSMLLAHVLNDARVGVSVAGATSGIANNIYYNRFKLLASAYISA
jgi:phage major head subunit gpT-like protein